MNIPKIVMQFEEIQEAIGKDQLISEFLNWISSDEATELVDWIVTSYNIELQNK